MFGKYKIPCLFLGLFFSLISNAAIVAVFHKDYLIDENSYQTNTAAIDSYCNNLRTKGYQVIRVESDTVSLGTLRANVESELSRNNIDFSAVSGINIFGKVVSTKLITDYNSQEIVAYPLLRSDGFDAESSSEDTILLASNSIPKISFSRWISHQTPEPEELKFLLEAAMKNIPPKGAINKGKQSLNHLNKLLSSDAGLSDNKIIALKMLAASAPFLSIIFFEKVIRRPPSLMEYLSLTLSIFIPSLAGLSYKMYDSQASGYLKLMTTPPINEDGLLRVLSPMEKNVFERVL